MRTLCIAFALFLAQPSWAGMVKSQKAPAKALAKSTHSESKPSRFVKTPPCKTTSAPKPPAPANEVIKPGASDPDHDRSAERFTRDPSAPFPHVFISFPSAKDPDFAARYPGRATVEVAEGPTLELGPGDVGLLPAGARTTWTVHETLRKIYVVRP